MPTKLLRNAGPTTYSIVLGCAVLALNCLPLNTVQFDIIEKYDLSNYEGG